MNRKTFGIMLFIKMTKLLKNHEAPICVRITVDGERSEASIKRSIEPAHWDDMKGTTNSNDPFYDELNQCLNQIRYQIYQYHRNLLDKNQFVTAVPLKNAYLNINEDGNKYILKIYQEHNEDL